MGGREFGAHAIVAGELGIDDDAAGKAQRTEYLVENVHQCPLQAYVCGVSINLSGRQIILANVQPS
jgi:hypothetical protein